MDEYLNPNDPKSLLTHPEREIISENGGFYPCIWDKNHRETGLYAINHIFLFDILLGLQHKVLSHD
jgi:hypothetical protein